MGHWAPTTLGNDGAWDALAGVLRLRWSRDILSRLEGGLAPPANGSVYDEGEAPDVLAMAELVAAGLGRPASHPIEGVDAWAQVHGDLLASLWSLAMEAVEGVARSPYATGWLKEGGNEEFARSVADLRERLAAGRVAPIEGADRRFREHFAREMVAWGWQPGSTADAWVRPVEDGEHRVRIVFVERESGWKVRLAFEVAVFSAQQLVAQALGPPDDPGAVCVRKRGLPLRRSGARRDAAWLLLGTEDGGQVVHPEFHVRRAVERALVAVKKVGEPFFAGHDRAELDRLAATSDFATLGRSCPRIGLMSWVVLAWWVAPEHGRRLLNERRERLQSARPSERVAAALRDLDVLESSLAGYSSES